MLANKKEREMSKRSREERKGKEERNELRMLWLLSIFLLLPCKVWQQIMSRLKDLESAVRRIRIWSIRR